MEKLPFDKGRVVMSLQGRDAGRFFIIVDIVDEQYVMLSDGDSRKLNHPKKKKTKHLHAAPIKMKDFCALESSKQLKDSDIRKFLSENGLSIEQPLCKEG